MPNHLTPLGIFHTAISILAILAAFVALFQRGRIDVKTTAGKAYLWLTVITCLSSFGIMKTGHLTPAHGLSVLILILLPVAVYSRRLFGKRGVGVEVVIMTITLMLSFVPAITETLTRLPIDSPIAAGPNAPIIKTSFLVLLLVSGVGIFLQLYRLRRTPQSAATSQSAAPQSAATPQ